MSKAWLAIAAAALALTGTPLATALVVATGATALTPDQFGCATDVFASTGQWQAPFQQRYTRTSTFGMRLHPIRHEWRLHSGVDLASLPDPGPVHAANSGRVPAAGPRGGYGNTVDIDHGGGVPPRYAPPASIAPAATVDATITGGQRLGMEGSTGASTGNHLHFEVRLNGSPIDPEAFMATHGAPLDGAPTHARPAAPATASSIPPAATPRLHSLTTPPAPIPPDILTLYRQAGERYDVPWVLLAGVGMEETRHGASDATSPAGARGLMQFTPDTFTTYGVDGDRDGHASITSDADSIHSAARYLAASGATRPDGVRDALFAYNHADWYVNDVLTYAHAYAATTAAESCRSLATP
ncbi:peptidoglycan DD-metalloendopeptidase family protein [Phycicoccus sp.]|uniref:peptidoglycan DD-metalloendopeptidase family protein n=1 Tax=Phycicoccus sp. TaxID=1902410 RepID=UPI002C5BF478|nr:peptidoglycan DD-metalloendopeptidase family protein [Phycicoccus sp.]HMM94025.1 peptidoglycan DD-metalloendopeptidase family protein [Phycicoccus sp.]